MEKQFDRSSFMKVLWKLMLPIVLQNLLSAVVSTADVLMLTHVSQTALSASSLAGQVTFRPDAVLLWPLYRCVRVIGTVLGKR